MLGAFINLVLGLKQQLSFERMGKVGLQADQRKKGGARLLEKAKATSGNISL